MAEQDILSENQYRGCRLCPRMCGADRALRPGFCSGTDRVKVARAALHKWEEPCISGPDPEGPGGSGTVFFSGCTLRCRFCQNYTVSHENFGREISAARLADIFLRLQSQGAYNINLVTPTHYLPSIVRALDTAGDRLQIPVAVNCGGYERTQVIEALAGYIDIWMPDLKYFDPGLSSAYSAAPDYFAHASRAVAKMVELAGPPVIDSRGLMRSGVIIRHLVLPGARKDSIRLLRWMKENLPPGGYYLSLLSQYTPAYQAVGHPQLGRRITTYEYESVVNAALDLGLDTGYMQKKSSAREEYTPPFDLEGVEE